LLPFKELFLNELILLARIFLYFYHSLFNIMPSRKLFASILFLCVGVATFAQGGSQPPPPTPPPPPGLPIDSGVLALFLLALVFGAYKAYRLSKQKA
jgi:hypothetical protein